MMRMRRCKQCVLPETIPNIRFDEEGVCNHCRNHKPFVPLGEEELLKLFHRTKETGQKYDCILGLSGGRDSSYGLWVLSKYYKLNVLAIHYRNPFSHPIAHDNVKRMTDILGVPLIETKQKKRVHEKCFQNNVRAFFKKPSPAMISMMCIACKSKWVDIYDIAKENKVPLILACSNPYESTSFKKEFHGVPFDASGPKVYLRRLLTGIKELGRNPRYIKLETVMATMQAYIHLDSKSPLLPFLYPGIKKTDLFYYLEWSEDKVLSTIRNELGWKKPDDEVSSWRFDCRVARIKDFIYMTLFGFTEKDDLYSKMIRDGLVSRKEALDRLEKENKVSIMAVNDCLGVCGMDIESLFSLNKDYWSQYNYLGFA